MSEFGQDILVEVLWPCVTRDVVESDSETTFLDDLVLDNLV